MNDLSLDLLHFQLQIYYCSLNSFRGGGGEHWTAHELLTHSEIERERRLNIEQIKSNQAQIENCVPRR